MTRENGVHLIYMALLLMASWPKQNIATSEEINPIVMPISFTHRSRIYRNRSEQPHFIGNKSNAALLPISLTMAE